MRFKTYLLMLVTGLTLILSSVLIPTTSAKRSGSRPKAKAKKTSKPSTATKPAAALAQVSAHGIFAAQDPQLVPYSAQAVDFAVSPRLSEMGIDTKEVESMRRSKDFEKEAPEKNTSPPLSGITDSSAALAASVQSSAPTLNIPAPASPPFEGLSNQDNANHPAVAIRVVPPDTIGDVGPNHYLQATNLLFRVFDKSGIPLTPPQPLSVLFAALGPPCSNTDDGDPIVLYDSFADRWIITQFMVSGAAPLSQCFAISQTGDPTGAYFTYRFVMPNAKFNDYPKFGVWPDGYYWTNNQFNLAGTAFLGVGVFALNRAKLLAGDPTANFIFFDLETAVPNARSMLPSDADGLIPPPAGAPNIFSYFNANEFVGETDSLRLYEFHADFANPASSTFTQRAESPVAVAAFDPRSPAGLDDIEQPPPAGATAALDSISDRLMYRLQYRNFGTHESLIVNHTVNVGTGITLATHQAAVRYYELRRAPAGSWTVNEQATFAPDTHNRFMGSAAMDNGGNLAVGYSVSSTTVFPSIRYAGRLATDPPNGLFQGENILQAGSFSQVSTASRWGDYSSLNVDPTDDCTFWYTQEYYAADNPATTIEWQTKIGKFKFAECVAPAQGTLQVNVTNCETNLPVTGASVSVDGNLYGATQAGGTFKTQLAPGTFTVNATATSFIGASTSATITNGNTTVVNLCITPTPVIATDGSTLIAESCPPETDAIDPGETVTVDFSLKNVGTANTTNLVATLQSTGGVTSPSGAQNYGVLMVGGPSVTRSFTFTADSLLTCGDDIIATLQLQDGTNNLGTVTFTLATGALSAPVVASSGNVAVPIPDLTTVEVPITVSDTGVVDNMNVRVRLNHTFDGDLEIRLVHPDGTVVLLSDNRGGAGDDYGTGANNCSGTHTVFDDSAAIAISAGTAPFAGSFRPEQPLSALNGKPANGIWKLRVTDTANLDTGTIGCVQLELRERQKLCCPFAGGTATVAAAPPATIEAESCTLPNSAPDADETVTMQFPLQNIGTGLTTNLVATLLPGGGVLSPSGPQNYGVLSPVGPPVSRPFTFVVGGSCGGTITATLQLQDGATNLGTVTFTISIGATVTNQTTFSNTNTIIINDTPRVSGIALATPFPSTINVSGVTGTVTKVTVFLDNFSHTFPSDVDILLVGPGGQRLLLMSDADGGTDAVNADLTFDDTAATIGATVVSGTFRPTNVGTGDTFPTGPVGPFPDPQLLSVFNGINPNGTWSLFVVDDIGTDAGSISGGWHLNITTEMQVCCDSACTLTCPDDIVVSNDPGECGADVNFSATVAGSCGVVTYSHQPGSFFPVGTTTVTATATRQDGSTQSCTFDITVNDTEGPPVGPVSASPNSLWPPNHKMKDVTLTYDVGVDNCGGPVTCVVSSVTSNEPVNGDGDGNTSPDWEIVSPTLVRLRSERSGGGTGRTYTITVRCTDARGNHTFRTTTVTVPHNQ
jgi:subtilisin-like proprotein convertase family protein